MQKTQELSTEQYERVERARSAIRSGRFLVTRIGPNEWTVHNGEKLPYVVSLKTIADEGNLTAGDLPDQSWSCTCMDFQQRGPDILCKHIEGVRLLEAGLNFSEKEQYMKKATLNSDEMPEGQLSGILWELRQPLDMSRVKRRQSPGMGSVPYLEGFDVIDHANQLFDFGWSFDLIGAPVIVRWQRKVLVWNQQERRKVASLDSKGNFLTDEVGLVYITGRVTVDLDGKQYSHADLGRCVFSGDSSEALDMALAGSVTDCLKRCFRQFGEQFGNSLYDKEIAQYAGLEASPSAVRTYGDGERVNGNRTEQEAFDLFKEQTGRDPASKDELRSWLQSQRQTEKGTATAA